MPDVEFKAPGPGVWELEQTHFARPATRYIIEGFPGALSRGFAEGTRRYGLLLDTLRVGAVHDFCYNKFCPVGAPENAKGPPPKLVFKLLTKLHPEIRRRVKDGALVMEKKLWREDMQRWDEKYKPDSIARQTRLQQVDLSTLSDAEFIKHLADVRDNHAEMIYRHHIFTVPSCFPVGHFLAEVQQWTGLLQGEKSPAVAELERRRQWRETKTIADAPAFLGGEPSPPPPEDWLPVKARANARAINTVICELFDASTKANTANSVEGIPVHPGVYEGTARIVNDPKDFDRLKQGDVLVARTTGPAFNVVLPLLGAIVTDRGGQLSHAAIVAREYGIPAVVGTREATSKFADGARVRVNGDKGTVESLA